MDSESKIGETTVSRRAAIARQIVEAHGGSIQVGQSDSGGARFSVILPAAARVALNP